MVYEHEAEGQQGIATQTQNEQKGKGSSRVKKGKKHILQNA
jgi:hypothetical protein